MFHNDGLVQERCNSSVLAMELHLSCNIPSISYGMVQWHCLLDPILSNLVSWAAASYFRQKAMDSQSFGGPRSRTPSQQHHLQPPGAPRAVNHKVQPLGRRPGPLHGLHRDRSPVQERVSRVVMLPNRKKKAFPLATSLLGPHFIVKSVQFIISGTLGIYDEI